MDEFASTLPIKYGTFVRSIPTERSPGKEGFLSAASAEREATGFPLRPMLFQARSFFYGRTRLASSTAEHTVGGRPVFRPQATMPPNTYRDGNFPAKSPGTWNGWRGGPTSYNHCDRHYVKYNTAREVSTQS